MQLTPRYGLDPVLALDGWPADVAVPLIRQRRRLADVVASFDEDDWAHPSRCEGWSSRDVIVHLDTTNAFWAFSIDAGRRGQPTRFLATFDPVDTPVALVDGTKDITTSEVLDRFVASTDALIGLLESLDDADWSALAEAPPGHVTASAVGHHALWDSWVHERDILVPMGTKPEVREDEVVACLRYAAAVGPALALTRGGAGTGTLGVDASEPSVCFVVEIGDRVAVRSGRAAADLVLTGDAVELLEALSIRRPLEQPVPATTA